MVIEKCLTLHCVVFSATKLRLLRDGEKDVMGTCFVVVHFLHGIILLICFEFVIGNIFSWENLSFNLDVAFYVYWLNRQNSLLILVLW